MVDEKTIDRILTFESGFIKLKVGKIPTWVDKTKTEGVELKDGTLIPFWIRENERVYNEPASDKIYNIVEGFKVKPKQKAEPDSKKEDADSDSQPVRIEFEKPNSTYVPEVTAKLFEKWKGMSTIERMALFQNTPSEYVKQKAVGKNEKGEMQYAAYVQGNIMIQEANIAFLYDWSCGIDLISIGLESVSCQGWIEVNIDGRKIRRTCIGVEEINKKMTVEHAKKSAHTDMIKKGLSLFGFNGDVYRGEHNE